MSWFLSAILSDFPSVSRSSLLPLFHWNAFGSAALPPKTLKMYFLSISLFSLYWVLHAYRNAFSSVGEVGLYRTRVSHCTHIKQHVLMMSQKETRSVPLSYRCSHEHQSVTQLSWRISSSLSLALFLCSPRQSDKSVSDLMAGSETPASASTSSSSGPLAALHCRGNQHSNDVLRDRFLPDSGRSWLCSCIY